MSGKHRLRPLTGWPKPVRQLTVAGLVQAATGEPADLPDDDYGVDDSKSW